MIFSLDVLSVNQLDVLSINKFAGTDKSMLEKLHNANAKNPFYIKPKVCTNEIIKV